MNDLALCGIIFDARSLQGRYLYATFTISQEYRAGAKSGGLRSHGEFGIIHAQ
jgi:hypothetical protein